ncbi:hypothetical protein [Curtobacterium sp. MCSS17_016]|uniref:hypothetical protein n=1 Tax=Curtobacterium sp. MCSS17_016 TaxID=2175644 RepID=UPI000DA952F5|nr:hypothetical protein [Curtobacterium sp. MCSS17_016]WIE80960.1 hypothetical protein DEJ19_020805 [Curtobacterium sp. MCSS17_016]
MSSRKYTIKTWYSYNVFGADEHYCVGLYRDGKHINTWSYSTFLSSSLAHRRAEKRIAALRHTYDATVE